MNPRPKEIHNGNINLASTMPCTYIMIQTLINTKDETSNLNKQ
jgi:hypothetical protein